MINFRIGVGFLDGIFHFDHGIPSLLIIYYWLFNRFAQFNRFAPFKRFKRFERLQRLERFRYP
jgi:hypothetical protein